MKIEKETKKHFVPVTLTLETEEEFKFLIGLANGGTLQRKDDYDDFDSSLDHKLYNLLFKVK